MRKLILIAAAVAALLPASARADGFGILGPAPSVDAGPYRYVSHAPLTQPRLTVVERLDVRDTTVDRWWYLHGSWWIPAVAYDRSPGGLSADGGTLVLTTFPRRYPPRETTFALLDTRLFLRHHRPHERRRHAITRVKLDGAFTFDAISPDGSRIYLVQNFYSRRRLDHYDVRALDAATGRLLPGRIVDPEEPEERMEGLPISRLTSPDGRWAYTLYEAKTPFLHALDTVRGRAVCVDLPQLRGPGERERFALRLRLGASGHRIDVYGASARGGGSRSKRILEIDTRSFQVRREAPTATASQAAREPADSAGAAALPWLAVAAAATAFAAAVTWRRRSARSR